MPATFANLNPIQVVQPSRLNRLPREMASNSDLGSSTQRMDASEWSKKCKQYSKIFQAQAVKFSSTSQVMSVFPINHHFMISPWEFTQTPQWYWFFRLFLGHWRFGSERLSKKSGGVPLLQKLFLQTRVARGISIPNWPAKTSLNNQWDHVGKKFCPGIWGNWQSDIIITNGHAWLISLISLISSLVNSVNSSFELEFPSSLTCWNGAPSQGPNASGEAAAFFVVLPPIWSLKLFEQQRDPGVIGGSWFSRLIVMRDTILPLRCFKPPYSWNRKQYIYNLYIQHITDCKHLCPYAKVPLHENVASLG